MLGLTTDTEDWLRSLNEAGAEYLVVGAHAMAFYGYVRMTEDLDTWINPTEANAAKVLAALKAFGMASLGLTVQDLTNPDMIIQIGYPPNRLDIITAISGVAFQDAYPRRQVVRYKDLAFPVLSLQDLKTNKAATGRGKDQEDISHLPPSPEA